MIATCTQAIDNLNALMAGKVSQEDFDALQQDIAAKYAALTGNYEALAASLTAEEAARIAAVANLQLQLDALNAWKAEIEGKDFQGQIDVLTSQLASVNASVAAIESWKAETETKLSEAIALVNSVKGDVEAMFYPTQVSTPLVTHVMNLETITVYAKFAHQAAGYSDLWVKYTLDEDQIVYANKDGKATVADEDKIITYWYQQDSKEGTRCLKGLLLPLFTS